MGNDEDMTPKDIERIQRECESYLRKIRDNAKAKGEIDPEMEKLQAELRDFFGELRDVARRDEVLEKMSRRAQVSRVVEAIDALADSVNEATSGLGRDRKRAAEVAVDHIRNSISSIRLSNETVNLVAYGMIFAKATQAIHGDEELFKAVSSIMSSVAKSCFSLQ